MKGMEKGISMEKRQRVVYLFVITVSIAILTMSILQFNGCGGGESSPGEGGESMVAESSGYGSYFSFREIPDPLSGDNPRYPEPSMPMPESGVPFKDGQFSTQLTRVTDIDGINSRHEYSRFDPFNCDKSMILLVSESGDYNIFTTNAYPYNRPENLVATTSGIEEPRWDGDDPQLLWGLAEFSIVRDNAVSGDRQLIKDFSTDPTIAPVLAANPDIYHITTMGEGEASYDRRYWAFILQGTEQDYRPRYILCWDRNTDRVIGLYEVRSEESDIDWVGMSPKGSWVLIGGMDTNSGNLQGFTIAQRGLNGFHRIDYTTSHADVGLDTEGNEVLVMQNSQTDYVDMLPLNADTRPILTPGGSYQGTNRVPLLRLYYASDSSIGLNSGIHISCNTPGYCLVSTHIAPGVAERNWLDRTNVLIRLDSAKPRAFYLSKTYNTTEAYWEETHGTITRDGSRIVWACNWNRDPGSQNVFLLQLDMPPDWRNLTGAE
jgi:hypothetical protein